MSAIVNEPSQTRTPPFERILCVTELPADGETVRQATALAAPHATIDLVSAAVTEPGAYHDLVVAPASALGLEVLRHAAGPVLITRAPSAPTPFPESILVAVDGTAQAHAAAQLGAELSVRHRAPVTLVASPEHDAVHQHALQRDIEVVERITGRRPLVLDEHRGPVPSILAAAAGIEASLIVMGRRSGAPHASVSAQVAGAATCSVLVVRAPDGPPGSSVAR